MLPALLEADDDVRLRFVTNDNEQRVAADDEGLLALERFEN